MRLNPLYRAFIDAGVEAGYPETQDYNGEFQEGFGPMHMTVREGVRESTSRAYLDPVKKRSNLTVIKRALVHRVDIEQGRATGIRFTIGKELFDVRARREVILAAGAIGSPTLLQLSGIGDKVSLESVGVKPKHILPGVAWPGITQGQVNRSC